MPSLSLILVALIFIILVFAVLVLKRLDLLPAGKGDRWPFDMKRPLTRAEQVLYHRLLHALPGHIVLAQVQVSRILGLKNGFGFNAWSGGIKRLPCNFGLHFELEFFCENS